MFPSIVAPVMNDLGIKGLKEKMFHMMYDIMILEVCIFEVRGGGFGGGLAKRAGDLIDTASFQAAPQSLQRIR